MADLLLSLTEADRTWALRHRRSPAPAEYLVHLAAAADLDAGAETEHLELQLSETRRLVKDLVIAVNGRWSRYRNLGRQVADALDQLVTVRAFLESLDRQDERPCSQLHLTPHRPVEGAA